MKMTPALDRKTFLKLAGAGTMALGLPGLACSGGKSGRKPNIIYIMADDLGYGDLGCYGQDQILTPHLDQLAAEGIRFTDHYAGSTVCAPSRSCLMTGRHTGHTYVRGNKQMVPRGQVPLPTGTVTVAQLLKQAGYATGMVGKWGLGEPGTTGDPQQQGFDHYFGYTDQVHAHNYYPEFLWRDGERVPLRNEVVRPETGYARNDGGAATRRIDYSHDLLTEEALAFVERNRERPFFLYLPYTIPHANNQSWVLDRHGMEVPDFGPYEDRDWPVPQKGLAAMITRMDRDVGRLMALLKELGLDDETIVSFTSDNGPHSERGNDPAFFDSNGPLRGQKRDLYEGGIRVPLIARWPGKIKAGAVSHHLSANWDFLPTASELAGVGPPEDIDGISYLATLLGREPQPKQHAHLYWEFHESGFSQAVRIDHWKGVRHGLAGPVELYDLENDIGEQHDVAARHPQVIEQIEAVLEQARTESEFWTPKS